MSQTITAIIEAELAKARNLVSALEAGLAALTDGAWSGTQLKTGDRSADGTVYVGISPTDGRPLYAMPEDLPEQYVWNSAQTEATAQDFAGHTDWRVPTKEELDRLYLARNFIGGFRSAWYWSSSEVNNRDAWLLGFGYRNQTSTTKNYYACVRCVRSG
jgi:hypothetical protein